jgi:glycine hydroxymethyltransferase
MKEPQMAQIADLIARVLKDIRNEEAVKAARGKVRELCLQFPLYPDLA